MADGTRHLDEVELSDAVDGLAAADVESHLSGCSACRAGVERWRAAAAEVAQPPPPPPSGALEEAVTAAGDAWAHGAPRPSRRRIFVLAGAAAAAAAVVVGVSVATLANGHSASTSSAGPAITRAPAAAQPGLTPATGGAERVGGAESGAAAEPAPPVLNGPDQLRASLAAMLASGGRPVAPDTRCAGVAAQHAGAAGDAAELSEAVTYQGTPAVVFVYPIGTGHVAVVTATSGCGVLATVPV